MTIIALMTDFGSKGFHYVASMKGVIMKINPDVRLIDISHAISSFSIIEASYVLKTVYTTFPEGTIFVVVIDPGVGSEREIIAFKTKSNYYFVGPNNGIFSGLIELDNIIESVNIRNEAYFNHPVSNTFHGRDIMSPIGAHISKGISLSEFGPEFKLSDFYTENSIYVPKPEENKIQCEIQYVDTFGNIVTNIPLETRVSIGEFNAVRGTELLLKEDSKAYVEVNGEIFEGIIASHFSGIDPNVLIFLRGSTNFLEISLNQGNAAEKLNLSAGDVIEVCLEQVN